MSQTTENDWCPECLGAGSFPVNALGLPPEKVTCPKCAGTGQASPAPAPAGINWRDLPCPVPPFAPTLTGPVPPTFPPMPGEVPAWYAQAKGRIMRNAAPPASFLDDIPRVTLAERMELEGIKPFPYPADWKPPGPPLTDEQARNLYRMAMDGLTLADALARVELALGTFEQVRIALAETLKDPDMPDHGPASLLHDFLGGWADHGTPNQPHELDEFQIQAILEIVPPQPT